MRFASYQFKLFVQKVSESEDTSKVQLTSNPQRIAEKKMRESLKFNAKEWCPQPSHSIPLTPPAPLLAGTSV